MGMECPNSLQKRILVYLSREMDRYKLDTLGVSEVRWNGTTDGKMFVYTGTLNEEDPMFEG
jgi:hypothetical protein